MKYGCIVEPMPWYLMIRKYRLKIPPSQNEHWTQAFKLQMGILSLIFGETWPPSLFKSKKYSSVLLCLVSFFPFPATCVVFFKQKNQISSFRRRSWTVNTGLGKEVTLLVVTVFITVILKFFSTPLDLSSPPVKVRLFPHCSCARKKVLIAHVPQWRRQN